MIYNKYVLYQNNQKKEVCFVKQQQQKIIITTFVLIIIWLFSIRIIIQMNFIAGSILIFIKIIISGVLVKNVWSLYNILNDRDQKILGIRVSLETLNIIYFNQLKEKIEPILEQNWKLGYLKFLPYGNTELFQQFCQTNKIDEEKVAIIIILANYFKMRKIINDIFIELPCQILISITLAQTIRLLLSIPLLFLFGELYGNVLLLIMTFKLVSTIVLYSKHFVNKTPT